MVGVTHELRLDLGRRRVDGTGSAGGLPKHRACTSLADLVLRHLAQSVLSLDSTSTALVGCKPAKNAAYSAEKLRDPTHFQVRTGDRHPGTRLLHSLLSWSADQGHLYIDADAPGSARCIRLLDSSAPLLLCCGGPRCYVVGSSACCWLRAALQNVRQNRHKPKERQ